MLFLNLLLAAFLTLLERILNKKLIGLTLLICAFSPMALMAETAAPADTSHNDMTAFVEKGMQDWHVPGAAVTVVSSTDTLFEKGFGKTATNNGKAVDEHTLFAIASTTKAMLNAGVMILVDEGDIALDDLAIKYIPELHFGDGWLSQQITVRDLMTHRTGLASTDFWTFGQAMPLDEQILMLQQVEPNASLRSRFQYQNTMYELLGRIIKNVSGLEWGDFLTQRLWKPIGMHETYDARGRIGKNQASVLPYDYINGKLQQSEWDFDADLADAAGSVWSSVSDMGRWAQFLLRDGVTDKGDRLISEASFAEMFKPQTLIDPADYYPTSQLTNPHWTSYGLGWFQQDYQGRKIDFHTGSLSGLIAIVGLDRDMDKAVIVLANRDHAEMRHAILWHVMDQRPKGSVRDWSTEVLALYQGLEQKKKEQEQKQIDSRLQGTRLSLPEDSYAGIYHNKKMGNVEIAQSGRGLALVTGNINIPLSHWHLDTFLAQSTDQRSRFLIPFNIGADARVSSLEVFGERFDKVANDPG